MCRTSNEPFILENDLVIMDVDFLMKESKNLSAQAMVLASYTNRLAGGKEYCLEESRQLILKEINNNF